MNSHKNELIIKKLQKGRKLFQDPEFRADDVSLTYSQEHRNYTWLRPKEIDSNAEFVKDGFSRFDINQGEVGNCWILAAVAAITQRPDLLSQVIVPGQTLNGANYCGAFRFRFRPFGREVEIMVDDRLPTKAGNLVYARAYDGVFWMCLLEKALAKLHGCYESLDRGLVLEAMADLTGGVCEEIPFVEVNESIVLRHLQTSLDKNLAAGAGSRENRDGELNLELLGLISLHGYIVTGTVQVKQSGKQIDLVRICNPWGPAGELEWQGKWSDHDPRWTPEQIEQAGLIRQLDGENWMELTDFMQFFEFLTILHLARNLDNGVTGAEWNGKYIYGEWLPGRSANELFKSDKFIVKFCDGSTVKDGVATAVISLEEPEQRYLPYCEQKFATKSVQIYKGKDPKSKPVFQTTQVLIDENRSSLVFRVILPPGDYLVIPRIKTRLNCKKLEFLLRVYTES